MANTRPDLDVINKVDLHDNLIKPFLDHATDTRLLISSSFFKNSYAIDLHEIRHSALLHAVIDDDREKVRRILDVHPELLIQKPKDNLTITSRYTWQKFVAEDALSMAAKRHQVQMISVMLPYFANLPDTDMLSMAKSKLKSAWNRYDRSRDEKGNDHIVIPPAYQDCLLELVTVFTEETFPFGTEIGKRLSDVTEATLTKFRDKLRPNKPIKLDHCLDPELLFYAAYRMYFDYSKEFKNEDQQNQYCVKVVGFIQSVLSPESAKILCKGLYEFVDENRDIDDCGHSLKLKYRKAFYHPVRDAKCGLGFEYLCGWSGKADTSAASAGAVRWKQYIAKKQHRFGYLCSNQERPEIFPNEYTIRKEPDCRIL